MNNRHIKKMAKAVKQKIDENPEISEKEIEAVLKVYWIDKKAVVCSVDEIKFLAAQRFLPMNDLMAGRVLSSVMEGAYNDKKGFDWNDFESAIMKIYPEHFDGFKMVPQSDKYIVFGCSGQEKKTMELGSYDSVDSVVKAFRALYLRGIGKFSFDWDSFEMFDPSDSFDVEETLREWQEWQEENSPGM